MGRTVERKAEVGEKFETVPRWRGSQAVGLDGEKMRRAVVGRTG